MCAKRIEDSIEALGFKWTSRGRDYGVDGALSRAFMNVGDKATIDVCATRPGSMPKEFRITVWEEVGEDDVEDTVITTVQRGSVLRSLRRIVLETRAKMALGGA